MTDIYSKRHLAIVRKLIQARKRCGYNQKVVARKIGLSQASLSKLENGQRNLDIIILIKLANCYHVKPAHFLD